MAKKKETKKKTAKKKATKGRTTRKKTTVQKTKKNQKTKNKKSGQRTASVAAVTACTGRTAVREMSAVHTLIDTAKGDAVEAAVGKQLEHDTRWPPPSVTKVMSSDYRYNDQTIPLFLMAVERRLADGDPAYAFVFGPEFPAQALAARVAELMALIDERTT